nr:hypothetical protein [Halorubrum sp. Ib24]
MLLVPICLNPFVKMGKHGGEYVSPLRWIGIILARCCCVRRRVEVLAAVVIVGVAIPSTLPRIAGLILLGVVDAEVVGLEPSDPK